MVLHARILSKVKKIINCDKLKLLRYSFKYQDSIDSLKV
ncbi:hypothetical protein BXY64_3393 [Marinifilum flexuosum]|uniref:Uncharacterized protein n=1 Tax=Marinifilum flexuosum TaxID=1117708 RepID=A0A419WST2_9BACT|nr:hypothetical protein BXY64_3393 [Marinifilum flexuosum]